MSSMNLVEGLHKQIARAKELGKLYSEVPGGAVGSQYIQLRIEQGEASFQSGSIKDMMIAYKVLEALE